MRRVRSESRAVRFGLRGNRQVSVLGETDGFVKTVSDAGTGWHFGAYLIGPEGSELIHSFAFARTLGTAAEQIERVAVPPPTLSEAMHERAWRPKERPSMPDRGRGTVIFDLDGTLVDSAPDLADVLDLLMGKFGFSLFGLMGTPALIGRGIPELVRAAFVARGQVLDEKELAPAVARFVRIYTGRLIARTRPFPGAAEALIALRRAGWRLVICTNKREAAARGIVADLDLPPAFALVAGADTFGVAKPGPAHLLRAVPDLPRQNHPMVVVGASAIDVAAAWAARMHVNAVACGYAREPVASMDADIVAESFLHVLQTVEINAALSGRPPTA